MGTQNRGIFSGLVMNGWWYRVRGNRSKHIVVDNRGFWLNQIYCFEGIRRVTCWHPRSGAPGTFDVLIGIFSRVAFLTKCHWNGGGHGIRHGFLVSLRVGSRLEGGIIGGWRWLEGGNHGLKEKKCETKIKQLIGNRACFAAADWGEEHTENIEHKLEIHIMWQLLVGSSTNFYGWTPPMLETIRKHWG